MRFITKTSSTTGARDHLTPQTDTTDNDQTHSNREPPPPPLRLASFIISSLVVVTSSIHHHHHHHQHHRHHHQHHHHHHYRSPVRLLASPHSLTPRISGLRAPRQGPTRRPLDPGFLGIAKCLSLLGFSSPSPLLLSQARLQVVCWQAIVARRSVSCPVHCTPQWRHSMHIQTQGHQPPAVSPSFLSHIRLHTRCGRRRPSRWARASIQRSYSARHPLRRHPRFCGHSQRGSRSPSLRSQRACISSGAC